MSIQIEHLTKKFGDQEAVSDVSFEVKEGEIVGFLGPNGAGKSTTMKIATGFIPPTHGTVKICGYDVSKKPMEVKKLIGYLPEHNPLYLDMYVHEYLRFIAGLHGIKGGAAKDKASEMVALCGLDIEQNKLIGTLSKGYRQRVGLAQSLIHDPKVLILDEPTTGLDPNQIAEIRSLIKNISKNKTVLFSTHIMQEVQAICDKAVIINKGKVVAFDKIDNLQHHKTKEVVFVVQLGEPVDMDRFVAMKGVKGVEESDNFTYLITTLMEKEVRQQISKLILEQGWELISLSVEKRSMEEIFYELTKDQDD